MIDCDKKDLTQILIDLEHSKTCILYTLNHTKNFKHSKKLKEALSRIGFAISSIEGILK